MRFPFLPHLIFTFALSHIGVATAAAQTEVVPFRPGLTPEGITYALPQTVLHITVRAHRVHRIPGEYAPYARTFIDREVPQQAGDIWTLKSIELAPYGIPDSTQYYTIRTDHRTSAPLVTLTPEGLLLAVNADAPQPPILSRPLTETIDVPRIDADRYKTPDMLRAGSVARRAELAAAEIYDIRENRNQLIKGQADFNPKDGEQLKTMLAQLDERENALLSLFTGTYTEEEHTYTFDYLPKAAEEGKTLFRFSKYLGVIDADDAAGNSVLLTIENRHTLPTPILPSDRSKKKKEREDLRYRIPGLARILVAQEGKKWVDTEISIAQFGHTEHLGGTLFNKKFNTRVWLSPSTGNIEKIELDQSGK